ncbi:BPSL0761 family protein [Pseudomonas sp. OIL-1]|uniref:BPSL0761 family protein n=1 Tax=Pseudomonas sp. OIL-1 TaxID=2706126 RepID=UPI0013A78785|nr:BPSL0761 family protein [Pseudomonas sp. OIL-1]QIB49589.1 hypothetical protein G3M63_16005 [Pseudomonas sp. OIL-1]
MTLPYERTRAVLQTREFLRSLVQNPALPHDIRDNAKSLLRHYPESHHLAVVAGIHAKLSALSLDDGGLGLLLMNGPVFENPQDP